MATPGTISTTDTQEPADLLHMALTISQKVVLVIDLVESVRLMSADEAGTVARWHHFVRQAQAEVIPTHRGRLVKSLGDGLMVEFEQARDAVNAAQTLHKVLGRGNAGSSAERHMHLRAGINSSQIYTDQLDIYGAGVNLAARLATLAGPGETIVSASVRDQLTDGLDADVEDMGECYLKHLNKPVGAYRVGPAGPKPILIPEREYATPLQPTIAIIPFTARSNEPEHFAIGELIAEGVIAQLSRTRELKVISRLSATAFRGAEFSVAKVERLLGANFVLSGSYVAIGTAGSGKLLVMAELVDAKTNHVLWAHRLNGEVGDLLTAESELTNAIAEATHEAVISAEVKRSLLQPLPTLDSYSLMLGGISLMHRSTIAEFDKSRAVLEHLLARNTKASEPHAWLAKWYVLKNLRGISANREQDAQTALVEVHRALDMNPNSSLALAMEGYIQCQLVGDLDSAQEHILHSLTLNPNEPMAWLFKSVISSIRNETSFAVDESERAFRLSPLDPLKYFFELMIASANLSHGRLDVAIAASKRSLRLNRHHSPTLRVLLTAQVEAEQITEARETLSWLLQEEPMLTVQGYLNGGNRKAKTRQQCAKALQVLGVPEL